MKRISIITILAFFNLLLIQSIKAEVKLPAIISSNMVLQRNATITMWGWAEPQEKIIISTSWIDTPFKIQADKDGNWKIEVKTTNNKKPQSINISSKNSNIKLENILFGEVWLCSGQSNMEQPLKGHTAQPTFGSNMATAKSYNPNLRLFTVERAGSKTPLQNVEKHISWQQASPDTVLNFSAVAYFFGQQLQEILDVPVGLIHTSWGGSSVQAWISKDVMSDFQKVNLNEIDINKGTNQIPTVLYNAMIHPLIPYTIKGALWYQGESNRLEPKQYKQLFPAMVKDWRNRWNIGEFPFYYVQIAPFEYGGRDKDTTNPYTNSAFIRETQLQCVDIIPNSGIAITLDLGSEHSIHPPKKKEVADRLLFNALHQTYNFKTIDYAGPVFESFEEKDGGLLLKFKNAETGLFSPDSLSGFEIAGEDKIFYPANAEIVNKRNVFVKNELVPNPVAVRYGWRNWVLGTLYDTNLLPASSFRSDSWEISKNN